MTDYRVSTPFCRRTEVQDRWIEGTGRGRRAARSRSALSSRRSSCRNGRCGRGGCSFARTDRRPGRSPRWSRITGAPRTRFKAGAHKISIPFSVSETHSQERSQDATNRCSTKSRKIAELRERLPTNRPSTTFRSGAIYGFRLHDRGPGSARTWWSVLPKTDGTAALRRSRPVGHDRLREPGPGQADW